ncbi:MAG: SDR family NAD(P)-dependent oxidoreductase [Rhodococcus sp.]|jgi:NAD(P)-dependent dehydrogenase (short-subunit alcohol dehydrogenase family)|uniref:SDR family NAD(P)-dependent oxidoreductase n=1 Tax=Rhodococcus TaxID=1827 RepID=UPI001C4E1B92|nr:SDR family NAD(P)-dependent oxidoreductase [Rhodococcus qingshengii]MCW0191435.1 SDR family NAD(P)-dependent oxidoreductase [Rhodococcus sp. (in: high G+C Gram-positive bacteria)]
MTQRNSVIVTGGTGGLGTAVTTLLLDKGWRVIVPWIAEEEVDRLARHTDNPDLVLTQADLFDPSGTEAVAELASSDASAPLNAVVNLVGGFAMGPRVHESPIEDFEHQLQLNLRPTYAMTKAAIPHLIAAGGGSIVAMSTKAASSPFAGASGYVTAKAGVLALMAALAVEYKADGIRANVLMPTVIDTPGNRAGQPNADRSNWVAPERIAQVIAFLVGPDSDAISGAQIPLPGVG